MLRTLLVVFVLIGLVAAVGQTAAGARSKNLTEVITLRHADAWRIMVMLGLWSEKETPLHKQVDWKRGAVLPVPDTERPAAPSVEMPAGLESITPNLKDNTLTIWGDQAGIDAFKKIVTSLDVEAKLVTVKVAIYTVPAEKLKSLGIDFSLERLNTEGKGALIGVAAGEVARKLEAELAKDAKGMVNAPIITTMNNTRAAITVSTTLPGDGVTSAELSVVPRVNGDGTITLSCDVKFENLTPGMDPQLNAVRTRRRVMPGEAVVLAGFQSDGRSRLIFLTATVVEPPKWGQKPVHPRRLSV